NSNTEQRRVQVNDRVLLKNDFDANPETRRGPLSSFFAADEYSVQAVLQNNMLRIKNTTNGHIVTVHFGQVKKIE
ncbi:hypothetical protein ENBRE01_2419, partial [Enteropsectra breve]